MIKKYMYVLTRVHLVDDGEDTLFIKDMVAVFETLERAIDIGKMYLLNTFSRDDIIGEIGLDSVAYVIVDRDYDNIANEFHLNYGDRTGFMIEAVEELN